VVLLPGAMMPLHIFEQRYQDMVRDAIDGDGRFALFYHDWDDHGPFLGDPGTIGCMATIRQHQELDDGRSLIAVEGAGRVRITEGMTQSALYFDAAVEGVPDTTVMSGSELEFRRRESISLFEALIDRLPERPLVLPELAEDEEVSYQIAQMIQMKPAWHHRLLEITDEGSRLARVDQVVRKAMKSASDGASDDIV
jgi:Lon protease-like protein